MTASRFRFGETRAGRYLSSLFAPARPAGPTPAASPSPQPATAAAAAAPRRKLLVVDDDPITRQILSLKLTAGGYVVVTALDAAAAIGAVRDERPDLVLLDLNFAPDVANGGRVTWDGFQIMNWLRGLEEAYSLPFILISASEPAAYAQRVQASGAVAFFQKPIPYPELLRVIDQTLEKRVQAAAPQTA